MRLATLTIFLVVSIASVSAQAQCTKDTDCKGTRICQHGVCVNDDFPGVAPSSQAVGSLSPDAHQAPAPVHQAYPSPTSSAPAYPAPAAPTASPTVAAQVTPQDPLSDDWYTGYFSFASLVGVGGSGTLEIDADGDAYEGDLSLDRSGGIQLAGHYALSPKVHLGGFLNYVPNEMEDVSAMTTGVSLKIGGQLSRNLFLSGVLDVGFHRLSGESMEPYNGVASAARLQLDLMITRTPDFKWGLYAALGNQYSFAATAEEDGISASVSINRVFLMLGASFGA